MGRDKRMLDAGDRSLLLQTVEHVRSLDLPVFVVASPGQRGHLPRARGFAYTFDRTPGSGPLFAVRDGLERWGGDLLVVAADLGQLSASVLAGLVSAAAASPQAEAVALESPDGIEPLCAIYRSAFRGTLESAEHGSLRRALASAHVERVAVAKPLGNLNRPDQVERWLRV